MAKYFTVLPSSKACCENVIGNDEPVLEWIEKYEIENDCEFISTFPSKSGLSLLFRRNKVDNQT